MSVENFTASQRPLARVVPELRIGPMLAAPLIAHDRLLGILTVVRGERAAAFSAVEAQRLRVIADHAALALWKAELLEQSRAADRAKGRFLATISHELRTPLTALTGYEELLADQVIGPLSESQLDVLERMRSVTHHLTAMIEEVLAFSSLDEGREVVRPTEFLAEDLVRAAGGDRRAARAAEASAPRVRASRRADPPDERHRQGAADPRQSRGQRREVHRRRRSSHRAERGSLVRRG